MKLVIETFEGLKQHFWGQIQNSSLSLLLPELYFFKQLTR